ncbi:hypothetical protein AKJ16_DCAP08905, partial [Drosera capensis]
KEGDENIELGNSPLSGEGGPSGFIPGRSSPLVMVSSPSTTRPEYQTSDWIDDDCALLVPCMESALEAERSLGFHFLHVQVDLSSWWTLSKERIDSFLKQFLQEKSINVVAAKLLSIFCNHYLFCFFVSSHPQGKAEL